MRKNLLYEVDEFFGHVTFNFVENLKKKNLLCMANIEKIYHTQFLAHEIVTFLLCNAEIPTLHTIKYLKHALILLH